MTIPINSEGLEVLVEKVARALFESEAEIYGYLPGTPNHAHLWRTQQPQYFKAARAALKAIGVEG